MNSSPIDRLSVAVQVLPHGADLPLPAYATEGSSGMDLRAAVAEPVICPAGRIILVPTGLAVAIPIGFEFQVRPRSGLALKHGIAVLNSPGTIDADYRGEISVILANLGGEDFLIRRGDRIAQLVLARVSLVNWQSVAALPPTERGAGGFGHSGITDSTAKDPS